MGKRKNGQDSEILIQKYYQLLMNRTSKVKGCSPVLVQHNVSVAGKSGATHQIDVYWEFEIAGVNYKTIIEVKDWKSCVKKEQLTSFKSVLDDIPGNPNGVFISYSGFQKGAITYANHHGIKLVRVLPNGKFSLFRHVHISSIHTTGITLGFSYEWMQINGITCDLTERIEDNLSTVFLLDSYGNPKNVLEWVEDLEDKEIDTKQPGNNEGVLLLNQEWYYIFNDIRIKVDYIKYRYSVISIPIDLVIEEEDIVSYLITDLSNQSTTHFSLADEDTNPVVSVRMRDM